MIYWVELHAKPGLATQVLDVLLTLANATAAEGGSTSYGIHKIAGDSDRFVLYESYGDATSASLHMSSEAVAKALGDFTLLLVEPPKLVALDWQFGFGINGAAPKEQFAESRASLIGGAP